MSQLSFLFCPTPSTLRQTAEANSRANQALVRTTDAGGRKKAVFK